MGDASQSIYRWRGADFRNIINFKHDYPDVRNFIWNKITGQRKKFLMPPTESYQKIPPTRFLNSGPIKQAANKLHSMKPGRNMMKRHFLSKPFFRQTGPFTILRFSTGRTRNPGYLKKHFFTAAFRTYSSAEHGFMNGKKLKTYLHIFG